MAARAVPSGRAIFRHFFTQRVLRARLINSRMGRRRNRLLQRHSPEASSICERNSTSNSTAGRQSLRQDPRNNVTTYSFDATGRVTGRLYPDGSRATFAFDEVGNRTKMQDGTGL